jgi:hypothetical protein
MESVALSIGRHRLALLPECAFSTESLDSVGMQVQAARMDR